MPMLGLREIVGGKGEKTTWYWGLRGRGPAKMLVIKREEGVRTKYRRARRP